MPTGIYPRTEEHRKKLRECKSNGKFKVGHKGYFLGEHRIFSEEHKRKISLMNKRKKSEETIKKMSLARKGKHLSEETKKKISENSAKYWKGKKFPEETIKKMSEAQKGKVAWNKGLIGFKSGNEHWNWRGGITPLNRELRASSMWKIWREAVFLRDNFICQNPNCSYCNNKIGVMLHPHHIKPIRLYPELAFKIENGITYCAEFHINSKTLHKRVLKEVN